MDRKKTKAGAILLLLGIAMTGNAQSYVTYNHDSSKNTRNRLFFAAFCTSNGEITRKRNRVADPGRTAPVVLIYSKTSKAKSQIDKNAEYRMK